MAALQYWLWLSAAGLRPRALAALLERYGDAEAAFFAPKGEYASLPGIGKAEAAVLERRDLLRARQIQDLCEEQGIRILTLQDADYPRRLRQIYAPPAVLYVKGRLPRLDESPAIAVIGTRHNTLYGLDMAISLTTELVQGGGVIVTPLTSAVEQESARAALRAGGCCIAVLGVPHEQDNRALMKELCTRGAVVSEYPPLTRPLRVYFRDRNRVAAGLSVGVLVIEAPEKSGTAPLAMEAAEQGKEVFAVPGNVGSPTAAGTLKMLRDGAHLATCGWDVLQEFRLLFPRTIREPGSEMKLAAPSHFDLHDAPPPPKEEKERPTLRQQLEGLNETELRVISAIGKGEQHIDDIIEESGLSAAVALGTLTFLAIKGYVRKCPGNRYALKVTR